jgi:hypothetical protein
MLKCHSVFVVLLLTSSTVYAQDHPLASSLLYRSLQVNALTAPAADLWTTLDTNKYSNLVEARVLVRRADGTADPLRCLLFKGAEVGLTMTMLKLAHSHNLDDARAVRYFVYGVVVLMNGVEYRAAWVNEHLPKGPRR